MQTIRAKGLEQAPNSGLSTRIDGAGYVRVLNGEQEAPNFARNRRYQRASDRRGQTERKKDCVLYRDKLDALF